MSLLKRNIPNKQLYIKAMSIGISKQFTLQFSLEVQRWETNSGIEWTVDRLKSIKQDLINYYDKSTLPQTPWVKRNRKGMLSGVLGYLFRYAKQSHKCFIRVLSLINIYTMYTFDEPREKDNKKFYDAVTTSGISTPSYYMDLITKHSRVFSTSRIPRNQDPFELSCTTPNRATRMMLEPRSFFRTDKGVSTYIQFEDILSQSMSNYVSSGIASKMNLLMGSNSSRPPYVGEICCTPNPGLKARFYASPHLWVQHVLQPLGEMIYDEVKSLPWDCTFDQCKPDVSIMSALSSGSFCYCFDLTSATDRFPFDLQLHTLKQVFTSTTVQHHIDLYDYLQKCPYNFNSEPLIWKRGQALGMYPSFGTFTLTHGMLLFALNNGIHDNQFFVLGDDVIILNAELAAKYEKFLIDSEIEYSPHKTITSNHIAEFAGHIYSSNSKCRIPKWKPITKENIIDQVKEWGMDIIKLLPKSVQNTVIRLSQFPEPYGAGLNPTGLSLDQRTEGLLDLFVPQEKTLGFATNFESKVLKKFLDTDDYLIQSKAFAAQSTASKYDLYLDAIVLEHGIAISSKIMGMNLYSIDPELGLVLDNKGSWNKQKSSNWAPSIRRVKALLEAGSHN
jgi:hypothetical protein